MNKYQISRLREVEISLTKMSANQDNQPELNQQLHDLAELIHVVATHDATKSGVEFITKAELLEKLSISYDTYKEINKPSSKIYIPDFPKPVPLFTGSKHRFSSVDVENFILKHSHSVASNDSGSRAA